MGGGEYIFPKKMERILNVAAAVAEAICPPAFRDLFRLFPYVWILFVFSCKKSDRWLYFGRACVARPKEQEKWCENKKIFDKHLEIPQHQER